jgi:tRNA-2-methylthio-N6-dimethylallyladenosine synthase
MFFYSERPKTLAQRKYDDDVPLKVKKQRLQDVIKIQQENSLSCNQKSIGKTYEVLIEGFSKKSKEMLCGRTTKNAMVVFPKKNFQPGQYVNVLIESCTVGTLIGKVVS